MASSRVALPFNVDYGQGSVISSSLMNGSWHNATLPTLRTMPVQPGQPFDIRIRILEGKYKILFNGKKVSDFKIRISISAIDYVSAKGDIKLTEFRVSGRIFERPLDIAFLGGHLNLNDKIIIYGRPTGDGFAVNLIDKNKEIAMFNARSDGKKVVHNCGEIGKFVFDYRESHRYFPFDNETEFKLELINAANGL
uniref:Galectin n=1 Tax=Panagrellus redivivus TaxID=6233 RepID=A0A7E4VE67_PANRE